MEVVVINKDQQEFVEPMMKALAPVEPMFVFDRCEPVEGCRYRVNKEGEGFLAGKMRDLGAEGVDDSILFLDGDKVPCGDIVGDIDWLSPEYDCICYGIAGELEDSVYRLHMKEDGKHGQVPWQAAGFPYASGCYSCGMWVSREGVRYLRETNGGRVFHPAFDGEWGDEDNFLADELHYGGFRIGYSTRVRLGGNLGGYRGSREKQESWMRHFCLRVELRKKMFDARA